MKPNVSIISTVHLYSDVKFLMAKVKCGSAKQLSHV